MRVENMPYRLGGLLYMPAFQDNIADKIARKEIPCLTSLAFCLEDSIRDAYVKEAEAVLARTLFDLSRRELPEADLPMIFVRTRSAGHLRSLYEEYDVIREMATGFILPKFDLGNAEAYLETVRDLNRESRRRVYIMPILESRMIADLATRREALVALKAMLDDARPYVLNVRVGGNDFSNLYGLRRSIRETIYDMGVVRDILMDILNVFSQEYVVSGPVWDYFDNGSGDEWKMGLERELALDRLNGFIGKTAIHPSQLPLIHRSLAVEREDYEDACALLDWDSHRAGVARSKRGNRMNEFKCHSAWAKRIKILGDIYGVRE
ncbi:MAG: HpcH/HpaI aldolase/citrate lyase family protein [Selenomonadaceae bacterium]|nr:HpcH/HpaI aldolase/citrate lyase family protein [Selenomonadaceae bacterium]